MADTKSEVNIKKVIFEGALREEEVAVSKLAARIVVRTQADLIHTGDYFPADITSGGSSVLATRVARTLLYSALRGGAELSTLEEYFLGDNDQPADESAHTVDRFSRELSDIDVEQLIQELPAEGTEA